MNLIDFKTNRISRRPDIIRLKYIESIQNGAKFVICSKINPKFDGAPVTDCLPYVLNPLNLLKLMQKLMGGLQIDNNNINSTLQYILQNCNFIEDIILLVSAQLCMSDLAINQRVKGYRARRAFLFYAPNQSTHRFWDRV